MFNVHRPHFSLITLLFALLIGLMIGTTQTAQAATFNPTTVDELIADIITANDNNEADIIDLGGQIFTLMAVDNGDNGLPIVTSDITIQTGIITRATGSPDFRILQVDTGGSLTLNGVTISGGFTNVGGGGGIYNNGGTLTITDSTISGSIAVFGGGIHNPDGTLTITDSTISGNSASGNNEFAGSGGGIANGGTVTITDSTISGNSAGSLGGGIENYGTVTISSGTIIGNSAGSLGGGISNSDGTVTITNSSISDNSAGDGRGGGIHNSDTLTITDSTISGNSADSYGGGINNWGTVTITDSSISGNSATFGGGIFNGGGSLGGTLTITDSSISGNSATFGGGIHSGGTLTVTNSTISDNSVSFLGGGISSNGTTDITCSNFKNNTTADRRHRDIQLDTSIPGGSLTAENNWWGVSTGPNTPGADTTNVRVIAWLDAPGAPPCTTPTTQITEATPTPQVTQTRQIVSAELDVSVTASPTPAPAQPICNLISDIAAYDLPDGFYCRVLMRDGAWEANPGTVPQELIDQHVILAVDVFQLSGQQIDNAFGGQWAADLPGCDHQSACAG